MTSSYSKTKLWNCHEQDYPVHPPPHPTAGKLHRHEPAIFPINRMLPVETASKMARNYFKFSLLFWTLFLIILVQNGCVGKEKKPDPKKKKEKDSKIGKNIMDYNEADLYKLLDQWEVSINMLSVSKHIINF